MKKEVELFVVVVVVVVVAVVAVVAAEYAIVAGAVASCDNDSAAAAIGAAAADSNCFDSVADTASFGFDEQTNSKTVAEVSGLLLRP